MVLVAFNTAIFIGSALIQKAFQVDILPIVRMPVFNNGKLKTGVMVCSMTGANPVESPNHSTTNTARAEGTAPQASPFAAFTRNFASS